MFERLDSIIIRYNELNEEMMSPEVLSDIKKATELAKEQSSLKEAFEKYNEYKQVIKDIDEAKELVEDPEMAEFVKDELDTLKNRKNELLEELELSLLPKDPNDGKNVIVEIRGAAGGDEANIFAGDLFRMYSKYAENEDWKIEVINTIESEAGGFSHLEFLIKGENVYSKLKYESGSHRVQRVPATESQGRVHTSTATVAVMPEAEDVDVEVHERDIKVDVYRSSGAGGQCVNTTDSAVRMTHVPTGIVVTCQNERSQIKNRAAALKILKARIYEEEMRKKEEEVGAERRSKIGSGDRSEKIRTYNYPQNRVTDHRIGFTLKQLDRVMEGMLEPIVQELIYEDQQRKLKGE